MSGSGGMITDQFWQPDQQTRSAIRRGDKINREYLKRKSIQYQRALIERYLLYQSARGWSLTEHGLEVAKTTTPATQS
jgi:hypothetical protein